MIGISTLVFHLALVIAVVAVWSACVRLSSLVSPLGLERLVSTAVFAATVAVLEALALGLIGLGGSSLALTLAAVATWAASRLWLPAPAIGPVDELASWWRGLGAVGHAATGVLVGVGVAVIASLLRRPVPGFDGITYHLPEIVSFVQTGHPGAVAHPYYGFPVGSYPLTNEVLLAWMTAISRGFAALTLFSPASFVLAGAAGWLGLRALGVPRAVRALSVAGLLLGPLVLGAVPQPGTDLPAMSWVVCCGALCACARDRPLLLVPAVVALGLSIGTKSTPAVIGLIAIASGLWMQRHQLVKIAGPLALGALAAVGVGGPWYIRNLLEHGSPLWPFTAAPWGDPVPPAMRLVSHTMAERFESTLLDHLGAYLRGVSGSTVLLLGGILIPIAAWRRRPALAAAAVLVGTVVWANAPVTGLPDLTALYAAAGSSVRYLLPVFATGALALALTATDGSGPIRAAAVAAMVGAIVWGLVSDLENRLFLAFTSWLIPAAALGGLLGLAVDALKMRLPGAVPRARVGVSPALARASYGVVGIVVCAGLLAGAADGYVSRHARVGSEWDAAVAGFLSHQSHFGSSHAPVATAPVALGLLAGDRLQHPLSVIGESEPCARVRSRARRGWVVIRVVDPEPVPGHPGLVFPASGTAQYCMAGLRPVFDDGTYRVYGPRS